MRTPNYNENIYIEFDDFIEDIKKQKKYNPLHLPFFIFCFIVNKAMELQQKAIELSQQNFKAKTGGVIPNNSFKVDIITVPKGEQIIPHNISKKIAKELNKKSKRKINIEINFNEKT